MKSMKTVMDMNYTPINSARSLVRVVDLPQQSSRIELSLRKYANILNGHENLTKDLESKFVSIYNSKKDKLLSCYLHNKDGLKSCYSGKDAVTGNKINAII